MTSQLSFSSRRLAEQPLAMLFELTFLEGRLTARMKLSNDERRRLETLRQLLRGDPNPAFNRRRGRRLDVTLPASVRINAQRVPARLLNISASGVCIAADITAPIGETIQVEVESENRYTFPCAVARVNRIDGQEAALGVSFAGIPLALRLGRPASQPPRAPQ